MIGEEFMNWIDNHEISIMKSAEYKSPYKFETDFDELDSYFLDPISDVYITNYDYENMNQFGKLIQDVMKQTYSEDMIRACEIAAVKCKNEVKKTSDSSINKDIEVPEFIYNF